MIPTDSSPRRGKIVAALAVALCALLAAGDAAADSRRDAKRHFQRGMALVKQGRTDDGVAELEKAYRLRPHANVLYNIARAYDVAGRRADAIRAYERYLDANPPDPDAVRARLAALTAEAAPPPRPPEPAPPPVALPAPAAPAQHDGNRVAAAALLRAAEAWEARARTLEEEAAAAAAGKRPTPEVALTPSPAGEAAPEEVYERTVVSASRTSRSAAFAPASVTVLTDEDIRHSGARTVPDLLRRVAGVDVVAMSATDQNVSIRGFNQRLSNRVLVLLDGRSVYQDYLGATLWHALPVSLDDIERVEVIRGPGAALYGANAVVGIINIITRHAEGPAMQARAAVGWPLAVDANARGSLVRENLQAWGGAGYARTRKWALELDRRRVDVLPAFDDVPYDLSGEAVRAHAGARATPAGWLVVSGVVAVTRNTQEVYAIGALRNFLLDGWLLHAALEAEAGPLRLRTFYNATRVRTGPQLAAAEQRGLRGSLAADVLDVEGTYTARFNLLGEHLAMAGVSWRLKTVNWALLSGPQLEHHGGMFGEDTWVGPGGHRVVVSGRVDLHPLVGVVPSARAAFVLRTGRASGVRAVLGTAFRNPTFLESYLSATPASQVAGVSIRSVGNRALRPEQNVMAEVGYAAEVGDLLTLDVSAYYGRLRGLIVQGPLLPVRTGKGYDPETGTFIAGESRFVNDDDTFSQVGGEAGLTLNPYEGVDLYANYAFLRVLQEDAGLFYRPVPAQKLNAGGRLRTPFGLVLSSDGHLVSGATWRERTFDAAAPNGLKEEALGVPPYVLVECRAAWRAPGDHVEVFLQSDNLLGVLPYDTPSRLADTPLAPAAPLLWPVMAHREHPLGNPSPARVMAGVAAQL